MTPEPVNIWKEFNLYIFWDGKPRRKGYCIMENVSNQIAYLKGLMKGLEIDESTKEGKIFEAIIDALDEINDTIDDLYDYQDEIAEQVDMIDDDLAEVEEELIDGCCDGDCDCCDYDDDLFDDDIEYYEIECPNCHDVICIDEDCFEDDDEIVCPNCKEAIEINFDVEED